MFACAKGNMDVIDLMIRAGANLESKDISGRSVVDYGLTRTNFDDISTCISTAKIKKTRSRLNSPVSSFEEASTFSSVSSVSGDFSQRPGSPINAISPYNPKNALKSTLAFGSLVFPSVVCLYMLELFVN